MSKDFYEAVKSRRTIYEISKESTISDARLYEVVRDAVKYAPSAFNSQSARAILLLDKEHERLWDITKEALRKIVPAESFSKTEEKLSSFRAGYGSVLFFEDQSIIEGLQQAFALYKDNFPVWSLHSTGMLQYIVWTSLEIEGLGASLQHYNPLIDDEVKKQWHVPDTWKLIAQMPFGKPLAHPGNKEFKPLDERVKLYK